MLYCYLSSKVNIWNVNYVQATAFIFDTRTDVLVKLSIILSLKMSRPDEDSNPNLRIHAECSNHLSYPMFFNIGSIALHCFLWELAMFQKMGLFEQHACPCLASVEYAIRDTITQFDHDLFVQKFEFPLTVNRIRHARCILPSTKDTNKIEWVLWRLGLLS